MYGIVIKQIREAKNFPLKSVYSGVCSKTNAIKFEKGQRSLSADKFADVLKHLMLTFSEFEWIAHNYEPSESVYYRYKLGQSFNTNQLNLFEQELAQLENNPIKIERIQLASFRLLRSYQQNMPIEERELSFIISYFSNLSNWTLADLKFFANNAYVLPYELLKQLLGEAMKVYSRYIYFETSQEIFATVLVNSLDRMISQADLSSANYYLDFLDNELLGSVVMSGYAIISRYYHANIDYLFLNPQKGKQELIELLKIVTFLNLEQLKQEIEKLF